LVFPVRFHLLLSQISFLVFCLSCDLNNVCHLLSFELTYYQPVKFSNLDFIV
jgi:hypothetical protein